MPAGAIYVGRPTIWGNPYLVEHYNIEGCGKAEALRHAREMAVRDFWMWFHLRDSAMQAAREELRGKDLACWCPLDQPCHADVLLEVANGPEP